MTQRHLPIKTVLFDVSNVLVFFSHAQMLSQISLCTGLPLEKVQDLLLKDQLRDRYEVGRVSSEELYRIFRILSPKPFTPAELYRAASDIFAPNEPIYPLVRSLKEKGLRLVLLSNTSPAHFEFIKERYPVLNLFDATVLSYEVGTCKPHPEIYQAALNAARCSAQECFYTDDIPAFIEGAKALGIDAEVFLDVDTLRRHLLDRFLL